MSFLSRLHSHPLIKNVARVARAQRIPVYLVGGAVRDALLGIEDAHDFDFALADGFDQVVAAFAREQHGKIIDWDMDQKRVVCGQGSARSIVDFSRITKPDIIHDLEQRDFTVNAMALALHVEDPSLIDPLGGRDDLTERLLRMCSGGCFEDDPLRMLRAVRFARQLSCDIEPGTWESIRCNSSLITRSARERIKRELFMILHGPAQETSLRELIACGLLERLLPDIRQMEGGQQDLARAHDPLEHSLLTAGFLEETLRIPDARLDGLRQPLSDYVKQDFEEGVSMTSLLMFASLLAYAVRRGDAVDTEQGVNSCGHEIFATKNIQRIAREIGLGRRAQHMLTRLAENKMRILQMAQLEIVTERAKVRFVLDCGEAAVGVCLFAIADSLATGSKTACKGSFQRVIDIAYDVCAWILGLQDFMKISSLLTGDDVITLLGLGAGPHVGHILGQAAQLERDGILQDRKAALLWLRNLPPNT